MERFINKAYFANLKSLKICGENLVDDLEVIAYADKFEFTMTNLEALQLNCDHYQSEQPASCILNKNFERLHTLHLSFKKNLIIDFDEELVNKYNMKIKKLSLCNITFGCKACVHFSSAFKELEVLCLNKCKFEELADHSFLSEFPKLKALSISNMSDELVRSIVDAKHSHFDLTSKLRARIEGICLEKIKDSTSSSKPSGKPKEETKKVSSKMSKGIKGDEESFTKSILSRLQVLKNLKAMRITGMEIKIEISKEDSFKKLRTFEILDCKVSGKTIIQNIQKYFPHLEELSMIELNIEPQKASKNGLLFPNIEKLSLDHTIIDQTIHALKGGKVTKEIATEKIYKSIIEDNKTLRYLETFVRFKPSNFRSLADEDAFIDGWGALEMCTQTKHIDGIKLFVPLTKEMSSENPRIPKTFITRLGKGGFSNVFLVKDADENKFACKIIRLNFSKGFDFDGCINLIQREELIMKELNGHPNILRCHHVESEGTMTNSDVSCPAIYMINEFCPNNSLSRMMRTTGVFEERIIKFYFKQLLSAVEYMHSLNIAHLDIKPDNILFDEYYNMKISDFGIAQVGCFSNGMSLKRWGTPGYMAPEVANQNDRSPYTIIL